MALLNEPVRKKAAALLAGLANPVRLVVFSQEMECAHCRENRSLAEEVAGLSDRLTLEVHDLLIDKDRAEEYRVDKVPSTCVVGESDYGIRFYGVPAGFEFTSLLSAIDIVGRRDSGLRPETRARLAALGSPVDIQVFATLTCPVCPLAATLAHRFALESPAVTASVIDSAEFPQLANLYQVMAVPKTVVNKSRLLDGALTEERLLQEIVAAGTRES